MRDTGYRILADGVQVSNDTWATGLANHDLIIGPTGGGKTFMACSAVKRIFDHLPADKPKVVVWLVPSDSILTQTKEKR